MIRLLAINTQSPFSNLLRFVVIFTLTLLLLPTGALAESGTLFNHTQDGWTIPDQEPDNDEPEIVTMEIDLSGAPANAVITSVDIEYWITHPWVGDLKVWLATEDYGELREYILWDTEGANTNNIHEKETGITMWNGLPANRTWYFSVADFAPVDEGRFNALKIWVHFEGEDGGGGTTPQDFLYTQDFTTGKPNTTQGWEYFSNNEGWIEVVNGQLRMDDMVNGSDYSLNEAILHLDLSGRSGVKLTLDHFSSNDENEGLPTSFTGHANGDGIAISADGINWHLLTNLTSDFQNLSFDLDAAIQSAGIAYTSDFQIKFQQYDNYSWPEDGRAFDNISIVAGSEEPTPVDKPFGTYQGTFESTGYQSFGNIRNWILRDDFTTESTWELAIDSKAGIRINPSGTYSFNSLNGYLEFSYNGSATIWSGTQISDIPCIFDVNGTVSSDNASGTYIMRFFPPNLSPFSDSGIWKVSQIPDIVSHISGIEICTGRNYNDPNISDDMTYDFCLSLETDNAISYVEFLTPSGSTFNIPADIHTQSDGIETWHYSVGTAPLEEMLPSGLIAHWKMDDNAATTTVVDSSGKGNNGNAKRHTSTLTSPGIINSSLSFNGVNDYITIPKQSNLITGRNDFTIAGWYNLNDKSTIQNLIAWKEPFSAVQFAITDGLDNTGIWADSKWLMSISYSFTARNWHHITWTRSGNLWKVYINGTQIGPDIIDNYSFNMPILNYHIGAESTAPSQFLSGLLDDVRIYNRELSGTEVKSLYEGKSEYAERWEYIAKFTNSNALTKYGDGMYTITVHHKDGRTNQTTAWFGVPNTSNVIPQPTQEPILTFPKHNRTTISPVIFTWEPFDDIKAKSIGLCLARMDSDEDYLINIDFPVTATGSDPISLNQGLWQAKLFCEHWYNCKNVHGIAVDVGKFSESDYIFGVSQQTSGTTTLIAHWKMDDNAPTTVVVDSSGRGNHGNARSHTSALTAPGIINSSLSFNGAGDYIKISKERNLITGRNNFTIAGWYNLNNVSYIQNLIAWKEPFSAVQFAITDGLGNTGIWAGSKWLMNSPANFTTGTWHHIAWTRNGNIWKAYIDGAQIGTDVIDGYSLNIPTLDYHIGAEATAPSQFLSGLLDDVRIYNKALSLTEVKTIYSGYEITDDQIQDDKQQTENTTQPENDTVIGTVVPVENGENPIEQKIVPVYPEQEEEGEGDIIIIPVP